ncbi:hypothetical protein JB92DRAFT_2947346 [Gautieria morchelliformis]|nr:hypothetical protein JB92DRAFT_2947346 [Gautieria morchelliformis]
MPLHRHQTRHPHTNPRTHGRTDAGTDPRTVKARDRDERVHAVVRVRVYVGVGRRDPAAG